MKTLLTLLFTGLLLLGNYAAYTQSVQLSFPIDRSVTQRNGSDQATVTVAGQVTSGSSSVYNYLLYYRTSTLDGSGGATSTTGWIGLGMQSNGSFYTTPTFDKGWYRLDMGVYSTTSGSIVVAASVKFGVGDVYLVAGQSNAQGFGTSANWFVPSTTGFPEWIVSDNSTYSCQRDSLRMPVLSTLTGFNNIAPMGINSWCYAVLGKQISDANGGMPVAFFNCAYAGSSILNWSRSSMLQISNQPFSGKQTCFFASVDNPFKDKYGRDTSYYVSLPYRTLNNSLNFHASLFGIRAILWHQGETEADPQINSIYKTTNTQDYKNQLQQVISQTRMDFGRSDLSWMVARATYVRGGNINNNVRDAQYQIGTQFDKNEGPDTDYNLSMMPTGSYRGDGTHFIENSNSGLTYLGNEEWADKINNAPSPSPAGFNRITANPVPQVYIAKNGNTRTLSVNAIGGAQEYRWGYDINIPLYQGTSITVPTYSGNIRCFIKDGTGNWRVSPSVELSCPSCRLGIAEPETEDPWGLALTAYPNPFVHELTIAFNVPQSGSDVRLELIDLEGRVVRTITDGIHDKGHWKYPVTNLPGGANSLYFCRLKVGDMFVTKKLLPIP